MESRDKRLALRRWSLLGLRIGLALTFIDFITFFGFPSIREPTRELLGASMKLLVDVPFWVTVLCLVVWLVSFLGKNPSRHT
jgi:hypothetical protein